ncbi:cilia- and flagella-associated protein 61-like [Pieris rapae]|uniref:cilia- and flagella-associated protein 61-like n=1 Tax=Pieris rapae TaxID=64459 RepID=UPI001E27E819|nr:cilia- and flagella-associated protein 61-like [Pieris rapae]
MSIFFDFNIGPKGRRFRRAVQEDKYEIEALLKENESEKLFGELDVGSLIELTTLSICMVNSKQDVIGFMSVCDHPSIPGVDPAAWETWMRNMYQKYYLSRNTLFIHAMCCAETAFAYFLEESLVSLFKNDVYLQQIVLMVPPDCPKEFILKYQTIRKYNYKRNKAKREDDYDANYHYFFTAIRQDFCPKLRIRRAVEEDNDDIVAILDKNCPRLRKLYGDYYISEIIGQHPEMKRKIIVTEGIDGVTGVMCLNSDVNFSMLQNTYELDSYHGLCKATPLEKEKNKRSNILLRTFGDPIMLGKWTPFDVTPFIEHENTQDSILNRQPTQATELCPPVVSPQQCSATPPRGDRPFAPTCATPSDLLLSSVSDTRYHLVLTVRSMDQSYDNVSLQTKPKSKVNFRRQSQNTIDLHSSEDLSEKLSPILSQRSSFVDFLLEEDPFDYEIVNIDSTLLTFPRVSKDVSLPIVKKRSPRRSIVNEMENKYRRRSSIRMNRKTENKKKFSGEPNAFMIELFGLHQDIDESHAFDLLEASFEVMKDYDYCIIRKPCSEKSFPLLQHFAFVPTKNQVACEYALYVAHRCSVLSRLRVRQAEIIDIPQIAELLYSLDGKETLWSVENTIFRRNELEAYVFLSNVSVVGIGILEPPDQIDFLRSKFNLDEYRTHSHHVMGQDQGAGCATLNTALVYPAFEPHYRFFVRDMLRLSGIHSLVWMTAYRNKWVTHKINSFASVMIPLRPRISHLDYAPVPELNKLQALSNSLMSFSCWYIGARLTSVPKVTVDCRLVVIGASTTAMAFLNTLLFGDTSSYMFFTNLTLISPHGLPYVRNSNSLAEMMFLKDHTNSEKYLKSVPYTYYVNTIHSTVVEIDKRQKYVLLSNGSRCYYDRLFLLCGNQYQRPDYLKIHQSDSSDVKYSRLDVPHGLKEPSVSPVPSNVFLVNTVSDANKAINFLKSIDWEETEGKVLVYGASIHAYCCIATLLEMKISPELIVYIEPFPDECQGSRVSPFCNIYVDKTMSKVLESLKIKVYRSYYFQNWSLDRENAITHVQIMSHFELLSLECAAFFYYGKRGVNEQLFMAVHKAGMGYSGGLLVDHQFQSSAPLVYAAGPAAQHRYSYHDSYEIGFYLGKLIRNELDPLFTEQSKHSNNGTDKENVGVKKSCSGNLLEDDTQEGRGQSIPELKKPIVQYCYLPGGLQYLEVRPPGIKIPHHYVQTLEYNGFVIETFKEGYFKLHLNKDLIVDGITCLTPEKYSLENFKKLYGLSSSILSNVHLRYTTKRLDNLYEFFREPWAHFLYHDHVEELFAIVKELLPTGQPHGETIKEVLKAAVDKLPITAHSYNMKMKIRSSFEKSPHIDAITQYVIQWVSENNVLLPMYLQPSERSAYAHDLDKHPAFKRRKRSIVKMLAKIC